VTYKFKNSNPKLQSVVCWSVSACTDLQKIQKDKDGLLSFQPIGIVAAYEAAAA